MLAHTLRCSALRCLSLIAMSLGAIASALGGIPETVSTEDWVSVRTAYDAARHATHTTESGFAARNPGQSWNLEFDKRGFRVEPDASEWSWGLELVSYGFAGSERFVGDTACASSEGGRVAYRWDDTLDEWYVNDTRGFEHGFTVRKRPASGEGPLTLAMQVRGELTPSVQTSRRGVNFVDARGVTALSYSGLTVFDADGETLPAWFELRERRLELSVDERNARYPLTIDPIAQEAYIKASNTGVADQFGRSVSISGDTMVVGAPTEDSNASGVNGDQTDNSSIFSGAAYVFVRDSSGWSQQAYLKASHNGSTDNFGFSVSVSGDTLVVSAVGEESNATGVNGDQVNNSADLSGAAYVFHRVGTTWTQQAYLKPSVTNPGESFGHSVSVSGESIVVGAPGEDSNATGINGDPTNNSAQSSGAAYVFTRSGSIWSHQAYLKASNTAAQDQFGASVTISGDTIVVGAPGEDSNATGINGNQGDNSTGSSGAAYVFIRTGTTWTQQVYLKASNTGLVDLFGQTCSLSGDTLVIGAPKEDSSATGVGGDQGSNSTSRSGAAYVFARSGSTWSQEAYLKAPHTEIDDEFGSAVSVSGDSLVVGTPWEDSSATGVNGDTLNNSATSAGAVYVFTRTVSGWKYTSFLKASNTGADDRFGWSVAVSGSTVAAGAPWEESSTSGVGGPQTNNDVSDAGAVFVFDLNAPPFQSAGVDFCSGDGGDQMGCTHCPCMNNTPIGTVGGCRNSTGGSARLIATGDTSVSLPSGSTTDLRFSLTGAPTGALCVLNSGDSAAPTGAANPCFGLNSGVQAIQFDGLRCAVVNTRRHGGRSASSLGEIGLDGNSWGGEGGPPVGIANAGSGFVGGQTRYFQVIHRDIPVVWCGRGLNTSQAVEITFTP